MRRRSLIACLLAASLGWACAGARPVHLAANAGDVTNAAVAAFEVLNYRVLAVDSASHLVTAQRDGSEPVEVRIEPSAWHGSDVYSAFGDSAEQVSYFTALQEQMAAESEAARMRDLQRARDESVDVERKRVRSIPVTLDQRIATKKLVRKVIRVFSSIESYYYDSRATFGRRGILRKDIDRYDDAIVAATGEVSEEAIAYVEETYELFCATLGAPETDGASLRARAMRIAMMLLGDGQGASGAAE